MSLLKKYLLSCQLFLYCISSNNSQGQLYRFAQEEGDYFGNKEVDPRMIISNIAHWKYYKVHIRYNGLLRLRNSFRAKKTREKKRNHMTDVAVGLFKDSKDSSGGSDVLVGHAPMELSHLILILLNIEHSLYVCIVIKATPTLSESEA